MLCPKTPFSKEWLRLLPHSCSKKRTSNKPKKRSIKATELNCNSSSTLSSMLSTLDIIFLSAGRWKSTHRNRNGDLTHFWLTNSIWLRAEGPGIIRISFTSYLSWQLAKLMRCLRTEIPSRNLIEKHLTLKAKKIQLIFHTNRLICTMTHLLKPWLFPPRIWRKSTLSTATPPLLWTKTFLFRQGTRKDWIPLRRRQLKKSKRKSIFHCEGCQRRKLSRLNILPIRRKWHCIKSQMTNRHKS